ncbi:MAG TPA: serine kinase, partial [Pseudolabrys sp.]
MAAEAATIHASAVLVGHKAVLIRGPAGSGKSQLVWDLLQAAAMGALPFARLVADDRAHVEHHFGRLLVRPAPTLAGMIEIRGLGIRRLDHEPLAAVALVVDLAAED